jgi:Mg2+-importing ATPase
MSFDTPKCFWSEPPEVSFTALGTCGAGLTSDEAAARLRRGGANLIETAGPSSAAKLFFKQFASPLVLSLLFGAIVSALLRDLTDSLIIIVIIAGSALLGFWQEWRASQAVESLRSRLALTSRVIRDGRQTEIPATDLVPGDVILLGAGNLVPADGLLLEATDFLVVEASLTGESLPVEKRPGISPVGSPVRERGNVVFMGSSVRSGVARVLIVGTGRKTEFGAIAEHLRRREPETDFARGVRRFGGLLLRVMFLIVIFVLAINQAIGRPFVESMLFAVALAVGLSPELLPAIVTVTLSSGARQLAKGGVLVRQLEAIENFGGIDILCTDKTGTITSGEIALANATDAHGRACARVLRLAFLNAALESGITDPLDTALVAAGRTQALDLTGVRKIDEIPYDFQRRRLTIVFEEAGQRLLVTKGAFREMLTICSAVRDGDGERPLDDAEAARLRASFEERGRAGYRVLLLASRRVQSQRDYTALDESELVLEGFLAFLDPPKPDAPAAIRDLKSLGITTKIISGDNRFVTAHIAEAVGLDSRALLTGGEIAMMSDEALWHSAPRTQLFVEIDPQQKERIVRALQRTGHAVGYLGDGINDAPALRAADIGISVDRAVDVARENADIVLLEPDLGILVRGVEEGRRTFANTLKYISITMSANFGNMASMALVAPLLPFLPLLPKQILLNNFLSDLPSLAIATDRVDAEHFEFPQRWNVREVRNFTILFGLVRSLFDLLTFAALLWVFEAGQHEFQSGWFVVSLMTEVAVVMVLRTRRQAWRSRPSGMLLASSLLVLFAALALPSAGAIAQTFGLAPIGAAELVTLTGIVLAYVLATEAMKHWFYGRRPSAETDPLRVLASGAKRADSVAMLGGRPNSLSAVSTAAPRPESATGHRASSKKLKGFGEARRQ